MKSRIMYIECKSDSLNGPARIGRVTFSKSGKSLRYGSQTFVRIRGYKANYMEVVSEQEYWISGCKKDGTDRLYASGLPVEIDEDVRTEYWSSIRNMPHSATKATT